MNELQTFINLWNSEFFTNIPFPKVIVYLRENDLTDHAPILDYITNVLFFDIRQFL